MHRLFYFFSLLFAIIIIDSHVSALTLRGVVNEYSEIPGFYVRKVNGQYVGFTVDVLNEIAAKVGFNYSLYDSPLKMSLHEGKKGRIEGAVGELYKKRADFAIGNLDNYTLFRPYVIFSEPLIKYQQYAALLSRSNPNALCTMEDILNKADKRQVEIGSVDHFLYFKYFLNISEGPFVDRLNKAILKDFKLEMNVTDAIEQIKLNTNLVYLMKSNMAEYLAEHDCDLTVVHNHYKSQPREIVIPFPKGSLFAAPFNKAIRELRDDGTLERLYKLHYTTGKCAKQFCLNGSIVNKY